MLFQCAWDGDVEGIRRVVDTGVQVDMQTPVSKSYHVPVRKVPDILSQVIVITCLLHSLTLRNFIKLPLNEDWINVFSIWFH